MDSVLHIADLVMSMGGHRRCGLSLSCRPGALVRVSGPSGAGKTTTLRTIARLSEPAAGTVHLRGRDSHTVDPPEWRREVAYLAQQPTMLPGTVRDNLAAGFTLSAGHALDFDLEEAVGLCEALGLPRSILAQDARTVSGGEAARIALVRALVLKPSLLLLDEITAPLDPDAAAALVHVAAEYVRTEERCALIVAHQSEFWNAVLSETVTLRVLS